MLKRQKEVIQHELDAEKEVLKKLTQQYQKALNDIDIKIRILESDELTQSRIYRIEHQKVLKKQVSAILEKLHADEYTTIQQFLSDSYTDAFVGTAYDMFGQGVPLILPIDKNAAVKAVTTDSKISEGLYEALGVDTKKLKTTISSEITRGIASGLAHSEIARNIANTAKAPLGRAKTIVRTESHRIQQASKHDAQKAAVKKGANVVKQWNSTLDGDTRPTHKKLDGKFAEVDEPFEMDGKKAMYPGDFGDPAEDCNCRCQLLQRAKIALDEDELKTLQERAAFFGLDKSDDLEDFKKKYLKAAEKVDLPLEKIEKSGKIKVGRSSGSSKSLANMPLAGKRNEEPLTKAQKEKAEKAARNQGYKGSIQFSNFLGTSLHHGTEADDPWHFLVIGPDAYPLPDYVGTALEMISLNGCMAHEIIGHYEAWVKGKTQSNYWYEEAQASIRASKFGVGLTDEERKILFEDGIDRLKKAGVTLEDVLDILDIWER